VCCCRSAPEPHNAWPAQDRPSRTACGSSGCTAWACSAAFRPEEPIRCCARTAAPPQPGRGPEPLHPADAERRSLQMNVKLTETVSDVIGVTGWHPQGHPGGERDPHKLAQLRQPAASSRRPSRPALEGTWQAEHLFALKQSLELYEYFQRQIAACDARSEGSSRCWRVRRSPGRCHRRASRGTAAARTRCIRARSFLYEMAAGPDGHRGHRRHTALRGAQRGRHGHEPLAHERALGAWLVWRPTRGRRG